MAGRPDIPWISQVSRSLSFKQARVAVIIALILGMGFSIFQIAADLRNERQRIDITFEQSLKAFEESAFRAAYGLDEDLAQTVVRGLFQQTAIFEAEIVDNFGDRMAMENRPQRQGALKWLADEIFGEAKTYAIPLQVKETKLHMGSLRIRVDTYIIAETYLQRSGLILIFGILRNLFLAIILAALFHSMLTRPLRKLSELIKTNRGVVQVPPGHEDDELGDLVRTHNDLSLQRSEAEEALRASEKRFRATFEQAAVGIAHVAVDGAWLRVNQRLCEMLGYAEEELLALRFQDITGQETLAADVDRTKRLLRGEGKTYSAEKCYIRKDGSLIWVNLTTALIRDSDDKPSYFVSVIEDIMERKQAEENSRNLITAIDAMNECVTYYDADDKLIFSNKRHQVFNSAVPETLAPGSTFEVHMKGLLARGLVPNAHGREDEWLRERLDRHRNPEGPFELLRQDGIWMLVNEQRLPEGGIITLATDISERKVVEGQLRQAQKMEAVGQLTAGVAHDFNNMLAVISGNAELLEDELGKDNLRLATVHRATERAAELIQRLLAFSRRQVLMPEIIHANRLIVEVTGLLRHTLEEDIDIQAVAAVGLWNCEVDPAQLENALVNLALNARDAMPDGGKLTIETVNARLDDDYAAAQADVNRGQYVMLTVTDTGIGMPPEVREHVFEPFFTTKAVGDGSGLGLSMVYGFVKQSGGHVTIYSEQGEGTTIKIYLPRSDRKLAAEQKPATAEAPAARGETVLVVEDDPEVRTLAVALLSNLGYQIMEAATGAAALEVLGTTTGVNLLLTDVVLPGGMNGRELATEIERRIPGIKVLYMSGYTENAIAHHGRLDADAKLLQKPFRRADLAQAVRRVLDSPSA
ncbi:MAG: PAS domain S-box protein [Alphaproteobacteria bacterium]|nr:PAS domain S-box protein [Alphaproteobacteria bacterium]